MIKISADSTCDLSEDIIKTFNISILPLNILVNDKVYRDGVDITPEALFRFVDVEGKDCSTTAVNTFEYFNAFEKFLQQYDAVIHICISSDFSSCYQNALLAARDLKNVYVVDSRNLSSGSGHIVYDAALMAKENKRPEEIVRYLTELTSKIEAICNVIYNFIMSIRFVVCHLVL